MPISVILPQALRPYARGQGDLVLSGNCATISEALAEIGAQCPGVLDGVMTEVGDMRPHVNIFVGDDNIRFGDGLDTRLADGDSILIVPAVSGG